MVYKPTMWKTEACGKPSHKKFSPFSILHSSPSAFRGERAASNSLKIENGKKEVWQPLLYMHWMMRLISKCGNSKGSWEEKCTPLMVFRATCFTHKTEGPWPLHSKHSRWWKRRSRWSKFATSHYAWGTNGVYKSNLVYLLYFIMCQNHAWIEVRCISIWLRVRSRMTLHYTWGSVTRSHDFGGVLGWPLDAFLGSHNFMVMAFDSCVTKWPLVSRTHDREIVRAQHTSKIM